jgi:DoxX
MSQVNAQIARSFRPMSPLSQAWPIPLRLIVGYGFMEHGYAKLARGPESFANILHALNVPAPSFAAWATILVELFGGFAVLVGASLSPAVPWQWCFSSPSSPFTFRMGSAPSSLSQ